MSTTNQPRRVSSFTASAILVGIIALSGCGLWPGGSDAPSDPIEFAVHLTDLGRDGDWEEMRNLMVDEFHDFDLEALEFAVGFQSISPSHIPNWPDWDSPDSWSVQPFGEATIVRVREAPMFALTLRSSSDGSLKFDPGPNAYQWAYWLDSQYARGLDWDDLDYPSVRGLHADMNPSPSKLPRFFLGRNLSYDVESVRKAGTHVEVTTRFEIGRGLSGRLATNDIRWRTDTAEGQAELLWTIAELEKESGGDSWLQLFTNLSEQGTAPYLFTIGLDNVPTDDEITVEFSNLAIGDTVLALALTIPLSNVPASPDP